ncbi:MAG: hypothetical protein ACYCQI_13895 [Gammaproteobacteria bacterium]
MKHKVHKAHPRKSAIIPKLNHKKLVLVPMIVKKHPKPAIGLAATLGLGIVSGLLWYKMKK